MNNTFDMGNSQSQKELSFWDNSGNFYILRSNENQGNVQANLGNKDIPFWHFGVFGTQQTFEQVLGKLETKEAY